MKVLLVKNNFENKEVFVEMIKSFFKSVKIEEPNGYLAFYYNYDNEEEILDVLNAYETELFDSIHAYLSSDFQEDRIKKEINIVIPLLDSLPIGVYHLKDVLLKSKDITNKREILSFILDGTGVSVDFVKEFAKNDLNASKASKAMFIHRNTLNYKLNKLKVSSGFDLSCFIDAYIIYSLIE